jgi:hypothetical protein
MPSQFTTPGKSGGTFEGVRPMRPFRRFFYRLWHRLRNGRTDADSLEET